jgi:UDPglucose 6-dehydrogenase
MSTPNISVVGLGFVGLTLAVINAKKGFTTIGIDINNNKLEQLRNGKPDFFEPKLEEYLKKSIKQNKIKFTKNFNDILKTDITFVTVGTPSSNQGNIDLTYVKKAVNKISKIIKNKKHLIVIKSTVIPTTTLKIIFPVFSKNKNTTVVVNPEFLRESNAINDLLKPHLIVIGENKSKDGEKLIEYYKKFYDKLPEIISTDFTSAEMIKYANNSFLATKISFINSLANICQKLPKTDIQTIANAIGKDPRIGPLFLNAGPGFGGSCLPKDISALLNFSKKIDDSHKILKAVLEINQEQPRKIINIIEDMGILKNKKTISILGVAFKKDTSDIREATSIKLIEILLQKKMNIKIHDPMAIENFKKIFGKRLSYCETVTKCLDNSDCCIILTGWDEYKKLKPIIFKKYMNNVNVVDAQRILSPNDFKNINFRAIGLGK